VIPLDMDIKETGKMIRVTVPGHSWITGTKPPRIKGWVCTFVNHIGVTRTEFVYRRRTS